ncbi:MAG: protein kinase [Candidatus Obscuribacterales bacterium]|nr:protein kinase [Candidatus Obscuribacterales bacterium]
MISKKLAPGTVLANRYQIVEFVEEGGMGALYRARHLSVDRQVAVKLLLTGIGDNEAAHKRFVQEAKIAGSLSHTNLVPVYDFGETEDGIPFLIMDFLDGTTLADMVRRGPLAPPDVIDIVLQICEGLRHAHSKGLIHRDLKPSNVMLLNEGDKTLVKVMDFGIAKKVDDDAQQLTKTGEVFGSPFYMSPEQCRGLVLDARSDIYAVGCIIFELLTGRVPLRGDNTMQTICKHLTEAPPKLSSLCRVPSVLEDIVERCLEKEPEKRYQSVAELADVLRRAYIVCVEGAFSQDDEGSTRKISAATVAAPPETSVPEAAVAVGPNGKKSTPSAVLALVAAAVIGVGCAVGIPYLLNRDSAPSGTEPVVVAVRQPVKPAASADSTVNVTSASESATAPATRLPADSKAASSLIDSRSRTAVATTTVTDNTKVSESGRATPVAKVPPSELPSIRMPDKANKEDAKIASSNPGPPPVKEKVAVAVSATPAAENKGEPITSKSTAAVTTPPVKATTAPNPELDEEQRLLSQAKSGVAAAKETVDGLIGGNSTWSVDWTSFDSAALEKFNYYAAERVKDAVHDICEDKIGKESLKGKLKKIVFHNSKQSSKKQTSFRDGTLELQASWSSDNWDALPSVRDIVQAIENGL